MNQATNHCQSNLGKARLLRHVTLASLAMLFAAGTVHAQQKNCIELQTSAETIEEYVNEQGEKATRLVPIGKVVPGVEVVWSITAKNICDTAAENIVIENPVPEQMSYIANSAMGVGTTITYSLDNKTFFSAADALVVRAADGSNRAARPDEIRAIRWTYQSSFAPGASAFVRYRALVK